MVGKLIKGREGEVWQGSGAGHCAPSPDPGGGGAAQEEPWEVQVAAGTCGPELHSGSGGVCVARCAPGEARGQGGAQEGAGRHLAILYPLTNRHLPKLTTYVVFVFLFFPPALQLTYNIVCLKCTHHLLLNECLSKFKILQLEITHLKCQHLVEAFSFLK